MSRHKDWMTLEELEPWFLELDAMLPNTLHSGGVTLAAIKEQLQWRDEEIEQLTAKNTRSPNEWY